MRPFKVRLPALRLGEAEASRYMLLFTAGATPTLGQVERPVPTFSPLPSRGRVGKNSAEDLLFAGIWGIGEVR